MNAQLVACQKVGLKCALHVKIVVISYNNINVEVPEDELQGICVLHIWSI